MTIRRTKRGFVLTDEHAHDYVRMVANDRGQPDETTVLHEGVRQSYLKTCELSLASGLLGDGDRSDLLELYKSLWPKAPSDIREKALMQPVEPIAERCPNCGKSEVSTFTADNWFLYGVSKHFRLCAENVLFFRCMSCNLEYTGEDGENKRMEAVRAHLTREDEKPS